MIMKTGQPQKLNLFQPATYRIKVSGALNENRLAWNGGVLITVESGRSGNPVSTLTITVDQAALQGLLSYLYTLGLPLISVTCVEFNFGST